MSRFREEFKTGAAMISIDTEQIWGHFDYLSDEKFERRFAGAVEVHDRLLKCLCAAGISATWAVVGGMSLSGSDGTRDLRIHRLPRWWTAGIPAGDESSRPLWYNRAFVTRLRDASVSQDVGLHGGLTHLIIGDPRTTLDDAYTDVDAGMSALRDLGLDPVSYVFPRDLEAHHLALCEAGIKCYRGRADILSERFGYSPIGSFARILEEVASFTPPPVWPAEIFPGLWNIPASMFIYSLSAARARFVPMPLRLKRVKLGITAAMRARGIFHLGLHPENLAESNQAFGVFEEIIGVIAERRRKGDLEILTMRDALDRVTSQAPQEVHA
jgi:hypothetical protein